MKRFPITSRLPNSCAVAGPSAIRPGSTRRAPPARNDGSNGLNRSGRLSVGKAELIAGRAVGADELVPGGVAQGNGTAWGNGCRQTQTEGVDINIIALRIGRGRGRSNRVEHKLDSFQSICGGP